MPDDATGGEPLTLRGERLALRSALVVEVPEAEGAVGPSRTALDSSAAVGVPAHVTVLYPFLPPGDIDEAAVHRLAEVFAGERPFAFRIERTAWFGEEVLWAAPVPDDPFRRLTQATHQAFPDYPPYGGQYDDVVPHLTVADHGTVAQMRSAERTVAAHLPIPCLATRVSLLVQRDASGRWHRSRTFALGG